MTDQTKNQGPEPKQNLYLGISQEDLTTLWYAKYWQPQMAALPSHIVEALNNGPQAALLLPKLEDLPLLVQPGYLALENGFGMSEDGAAVVTALTKMPRVTPAMWDWWFGWHGSDSKRYKLWNPQAHLYAAWQDGLTQNPGKTDRDDYLNRTSLVDEYVGSTKMSLAIHFMPPATLGFDESLLADPEQATVICGRVGLSELPIDSGYLVHYIRRTAEGAEMRSRFWLGGKYLAPRDGSQLPKDKQGMEAATVLWQAYSLLVHCAKEMNHLAAFLPEIYRGYLNREDY